MKRLGAGKGVVAQRFGCRWHRPKESLAPYTRTVDMHVAELPKKIEDAPAEPPCIVTVHRAGYKFTG